MGQLVQQPLLNQAGLEDLRCRWDPWRLSFLMAQPRPFRLACLEGQEGLLARRPRQVDLPLQWIQVIPVLHLRLRHQAVREDHRQ